ncbi:AraC family transcriptional regulator [Gracilibacillus caseinilyticus]|uniref:AraC family transcriptional regulator n=1 Tax=Gracilibacillus caseinilyticus TaxID=2932256 RepID=A0ABY4ER49_9BACI|nr:helix-turn-helix domain-containing protein [Gracilibacillus caseinilyticus]UOQ46699.1 AraC family transcriptional regulator [Gracilibacillus caseinilyticus]
MSHFPKVVAYYYKRWHEFEMALHQHQAMEIMYVIDGKCQVEVDQRTVQIRKGQYIFIQSQVNHRLIIDKAHPCRMLNLEFIMDDKDDSYISFDKIGAQLKDLWDSNSRYLLLKDEESVFFTLRQLVLELDHQSSDNELLIDNLMVQLLMWMARNRRELESDADNQYIKKALTFIHESYDTEITVTDIANVTHLHPNYLHRLFKQSLGHTINQYITKVRMDKAKMLLVNTEIPVTDIANYVGMNTSQYFSRTFKRNTGLSPSAYREHFREI